MFTAAQERAIRQAAKARGQDEAAVLAITEVESDATAYWTVNGKLEPAIRFEGHYFHQRLSGEALRIALDQGLASPKAGKVKNPSSYAARYAMFDRAYAIDPVAAIESTSWGVGQVMGAHWQALGFRSASAYMQYVRRGLREQVDVMLRFIEMAGLGAALAKKDWKAFARGYNGPAYAQNRYPQRLAAAYKRWSAGPGDAVNQVREAQTLLKKLGYDPGPIDGVLGSRTIAAVKKFQRDNGLVVDGIIGPMTLAELRIDAAALDEKRKTKALPGVAAGGVGTAVAVDQVLDAVDKASSAGSSVESLLSLVGVEGLVAGLVIAAVVGGIIYLMLRKRREAEAHA